MPIQQWVMKTRGRKSEFQVPLFALPGFFAPPFAGGFPWAGGSHHFSRESLKENANRTPIMGELNIRGERRSKKPAALERLCRGRRLLPIRKSRFPLPRTKCGHAESKIGRAHV